MRTVWIVVVLLIGSGGVVFAQVAPEATAPTGSLTAPPGEWQSSIVLAFFLTSAWEWAKRKEWVRFVDERASFWSQRIAAVLLATVTAAGLSYSFDPHAGRLVIDGLTFSGVLGALKDIGWQATVQEVMFRKVVKPYSKEAGTT